MAGRLCDNGHYELWTAEPGSQEARRDVTKWWTDLKWPRARSTVTQATVTLTKSGPAGPCLFADDMQTVFQDLVVRRGGYTVWRGPMSRIVEKHDTIEVTALDRGVWFGPWHTTDLAHAFATLPGMDLGDVMASYIQHALGDYPAGVYVPPPPFVGVTASRSVLPGVATADKDLSELAKTGCAWTMAPDLILGDDPRPALLLADSDLSGDVALVEDGEAWGSRVWQNGEGTIQESYGGPIGGIMKDVVVSNPEIKDAESALWAAQTYKATLGGDRPPVTVVVGSGCSINADAPVTFGDLIPGRRFRFTLSPEWQRRGSSFQYQMLTGITVSISKGGAEKVEAQFVPGPQI